MYEENILYADGAAISLKWPLSYLHLTKFKQQMLTEQTMNSANNIKLLGGGGGGANRLLTQTDMDKTLAIRFFLQKVCLIYDLMWLISI